MKTSSCKAKGRRLQQYVRDKLREKYCLSCIRCEAGTCKGYSDLYHKPSQLKEGDIECTLMGESGRDIKLSPLAEDLIEFDIETKNTETASPWQWMKQAKANTKPGRKPLVVFTRNREKDIYAMIRLDDLLELL